MYTRRSQQFDDHLEPTNSPVGGIIQTTPFNTPSDYERPATLEQPIVASRLATFTKSLPNGPERAKCEKVLNNLKSNQPASEWWQAQSFSDKPMPKELQGTTIGILEVSSQSRAPRPLRARRARLSRYSHDFSCMLPRQVNWPNPALMTNQRRYAVGPSAFGLPRAARAAATGGLFVDGDLEGSELSAYEHVCKLIHLDCDILDEHILHREEQLEELGQLLPQAYDAQLPSAATDAERAACWKASPHRDFAKKLVSAITHLASWKPVDTPVPNAAWKLFEEYGIDPASDAVRVPAWLKGMQREFRANVDVLVDGQQVPEHLPVLNELRRVFPEKASLKSSALHYVLAQYEYIFLDACLAHGESIGLVMKDDCLDGALWLAPSFPADKSRADVFKAMTAAARQSTGMLKFTIREKAIDVPPMPARKTAAFPMQGFQQAFGGLAGLGDAGLKQVWQVCDRHWCSLQGSSKAIVVEQFYLDDSDIVRDTIQRTNAEFTQVYGTSCKLTIPKDAGGSGKPESLPKLWLEREDRPVKFGIDFLTTAAARQSQPDILSTFTGLPLDESAPFSFADASQHSGVRIIQEHISTILADGDSDVAQYVTHWHAYALQKRTKTGVMLAFVGASGSGKSTLYFKSTHNHPIMRELFWRMYQGVPGLAQVLARFNSMTGNKLLCVCEEIGEKAGVQNMAHLKFLADAEEVPVEAKHLDAIMMRDCRNFVMLTNYHNAFGLDGDTGDFSRKVAIFRVSEKFSTRACRDDPDVAAAAKAYFTRLNAAMQDPETLRAYFWYNMNMDLTDFSPYEFKETAVMQDMRQAADATLGAGAGWLRAWAGGEWPAALAQFGSSAEPEGYAPYEQDKFYSHATLIACFRAYAAECSREHVSLEDKDVRDILRRLVKPPHSLLKECRSSSARGYKLVLPASAASPSPLPAASPPPGVESTAGVAARAATSDDELTPEYSV